MYIVVKYKINLQICMYVAWYSWGFDGYEVCFHILYRCFYILFLFSFIQKILLTWVLFVHNVQVYIKLCIRCVYRHFQKKFVDTKEIYRSHKSKNRQYNG